MAEWKEHLKRAVALVGSQAKLAALMSLHGRPNTTQSRINWLITTAEQIPAEDSLAVHRAVKGQVTASELRPDLWPTVQHVPIEPEQARDEQETAAR